MFFTEERRGTAAVAGEGADFIMSKIIIIGHDRWEGDGRVGGVMHNLVYYVACTDHGR